MTVRPLALRPLALRLAALAGTLLIAASLVLIVSARLSVGRDVYVSELGAEGVPTARVFQVALLLLVAGSAAIAFAARDIRSRARVLRWWRPSVTLWVAGALFLLASQVTCTAGCPVPQGALFTWQDLIHTTAATLAFAAACWAMLQCAAAVGHPLLARFSLAAALSVAVIAGVGGLMSVADFYSWFGSRLELVATLIGMAWIAVLGLSIVSGRGSARASAPVSAPVSASAPPGVPAHQLEQAVGQPD